MISKLFPHSKEQEVPQEPKRQKAPASRAAGIERRGYSGGVKHYNIRRGYL